jgi:ribonuclease R
VRRVEQLRKSYSLSDDPFAAREAERYDIPLPSREYILQYLTESGTPATGKQIIRAFEITDEESAIGIKRRLRAMEHDGQIIRNRRGAYGIVKKMDLIHGVVVAHRDGFGFLVPDEGGGDLYLPAREMRKALHGDRVLAQVTTIDRRGRREAEIVEVLEYAIHQVVGRLHFEEGVYYVTPDNKRITQIILIQPEATLGAADGQMVVVDLLREKLQTAALMGKVKSIMLQEHGTDLEIDISIHNYDLPNEWPDAVEREVKHYTEQVAEKDKHGRIDLRTIPLVTIDGEDAKDFDDAVYAERLPRGDFRLLVAIADVSHYVKPGSELDKEAQNRGTSVYFPGRVIPMLPPILSNGLCSLMPKTDRLCLVADMTISKTGQLKSSQFYEAVMYSHARLTYTEVASILVDHDPTLSEQHHVLVPHLETLHALYHCLRQKRDERGAIDFDTTETKFVFDEKNRITKIVPTTRNDAHRLIEECMITANVAAAQFLESHKIPILYRNHEPPPPDKLEDLRNFLSEFHIHLTIGKVPNPAMFGEVIEKINKKPFAHLVQTVLLRSLSQAQYTPTNQGHFGLSLQAYTHFTSPIRRYPDLLVHRAIRYLLTHKNLNDYAYDLNRMSYLGTHCSTTERRADEATRDVEARLKCEYMLDKIDEEFDGIISNVAGFGIFVELSNVYVDGLVHVTSLKNDYYHFNPIKHRLMGERTGKCYRLGDQVRVKLVNVDVDARKIDLALIEPEKSETKDKKHDKEKLGGDAKKKAKPMPRQHSSQARSEKNPSPNKTRRKKR